ncbi:uncharacterized protein BDZ99DRAFT_519976 [Mytilinidion resinicola]|uniref:RING-type domain-containing protein n=1 Tax=Mytilinidion resinicola TaxID=574789 RepID=A0A6A6YMV5_9PEZI|nr:uncharacterized protein BDZ99DRAFT_519976 [Mytilinidion resinicola]KAF2809878.1 hypothetical protein BDZ99DRAFT_519976 [Mytilinidion resinicola]
MAPFLLKIFSISAKKQTQPPLDRAVISAAAQVLHTPELAEMIFLELEDRFDILRCFKVCKQWKDIIDTSPALSCVPYKSILKRLDCPKELQLGDLTQREKDAAALANCKYWHGSKAPQYLCGPIDYQRFRTTANSICWSVRNNPQTFYLSFAQDLNDHTFSRGYRYKRASCRNMLLIFLPPTKVVVRSRCYMPSAGTRFWHWKAQSDARLLRAKIKNQDGIQIGQIIDCNMGILMSLTFGPGLLRCGMGLIAHQHLYATHPTTWLSIFDSFLPLVECCNFMMAIGSIYKLLKLRSRLHWNVILYHDGFEYSELLIFLLPVMLFAHPLNQPPQFVTEVLAKHTDGCPICLRPFSFHDMAVQVIDSKCHHVFGHDCLDTWIQSRTNCPLCRANLPVPVSVAALPIPRRTLKGMLEEHSDVLRRITFVGAWMLILYSLPSFLCFLGLGRAKRIMVEILAVLAVMVGYLGPWVTLAILLAVFNPLTFIAFLYWYAWDGPVTVWTGSVTLRQP